MQNNCLITFKKIQKQPPEVFYKKAVVNSEYCEIFESTYFEEHLRTAASENVFMKLRKKRLFKETSENVCFYFMKETRKNAFFISRLFSFGVGIQIQYFCDVVRNKLQTINIYLS